jgi:hypothetical protein
MSTTGGSNVGAYIIQFYKENRPYNTDGRARTWYLRPIEQRIVSLCPAYLGCAVEPSEMRGSGPLPLSRLPKD